MAPSFKPQEDTFENEKPEKVPGLQSAPGHKVVLRHLKPHFLKSIRKADDMFTKPVIKKFRDRWYIEYYFKVPPEFRSEYPTGKKRIKIYQDLNRVKGAERESMAIAMRDDLHHELKNGYNPFKPELVDLEKERLAQLKSEGEPLYNLLDIYIKAKVKEGVKSIGSFQTPVNHLREWMKAKGWESRGISLFTEDDIIEFLETYRVDKTWSSGTYNTNRTYLFMFFNWFAKKKIIQVSPLTQRIDTATKNDVTRNEDYQGRVRELVNKELDKDPVLKRLCQGVYYTCARSYKELCFIQVWHVDRAGKLIKVPDGKTGYRHIPLCDELEDLLFNEMKLDSFPLDYYVFAENALPGKNVVYKNYFSLRYKKLKDEIKIGDEYSIYGWKHTRVCDLLASGLYTDHEVMELTGHSDTRSFDKYKRGLGRRITNKLKGKTISF